MDIYKLLPNEEQYFYFILQPLIHLFLVNATLPNTYKIENKIIIMKLN